METVTDPDYTKAPSPQAAAYAKALVAGWPEISKAQADRVAILLRGETVSPLPHQPTERELVARQEAEGRAMALQAAKDLALSLTACDVCDLQPETHNFQRSYGDFHEWAPGRADRVVAKRGRARA
jgi:hypothetical protein